MSHNNIYELPDFLNCEGSLFPPFSETSDFAGSEFLSSLPLFDDLSTIASEFTPEFFNFLGSDDSSTSFASTEDVSQAALNELLTPVLRDNLSPSLSPATTLRASPDIDLAFTATHNFSDEKLEKVPMDPSFIAMYSDMVSKMGFTPPPEIEFNLETFLNQNAHASTYPGLELPMESFKQSTKSKINSVTMPVTEELPNLNVSGLRKVLETYVKRQQEELLLKQQKDMELSKPKKSKVGRKPKPRATDPLGIMKETIEKRAKNTAAARKSRMKRAEKVDELETRITKLLNANSQNLKRSRLFEERMNILEKELATANAIMEMNGLGNYAKPILAFEAMDEVVISDSEE